MGNQKETELEVQDSDGARIGDSTPSRSNGRSSVNRSACRYRGYKVLGIMLLWLVVLAEASLGEAIATTLAGAALAATAAGVGATVNYWAAMADETTGYLRVLSKKR